jgi:hypothetical protein
VIRSLIFLKGPTLMLKTSKTVTRAVDRRNLYAKGSDLSNKRDRLLELQELDERRTKLLAEAGTISEQMSVLKTKIAEDLAVFRR